MNRAPNILLQLQVTHCVPVHVHAVCACACADGVFLYIGGSISHVGHGDFILTKSVHGQTRQLCLYIWLLAAIFAWSVTLLCFYWMQIRTVTLFFKITLLSAVLLSLARPNSCWSHLESFLGYIPMQISATCFCVTNLWLFTPTKQDDDPMLEVSPCPV